MARDKSSRGKRVRVQVGDVEVSLRLKGEGERGLPQEEWLPFSPTEQKVVSLLLSKAALSRDEIAKELDESVDGRLKNVLANLVARRVLLVTHEGYRVNAPEYRRRTLLRWLGEASGNDEEPVQ